MFFHCPFPQVIKVDFASLDRILKNDSALYRKYHLSLSQQHSCDIPPVISAKTNGVFEKAVKSLNIIELLDSNTALRKLTAVQKRHLQCLVEGPIVYAPGQRLWRIGSAVDKAFIIVAGTVSFVPKRRHGGSTMSVKPGQKASRVKKKHETKVTHVPEEDNRLSIGEAMKSDAIRAVRELQAVSDDVHYVVVKYFLAVLMSMTASFVKQLVTGDDEVGNISTPSDIESSSTLSNSLVLSDEYARLSRGLQKWAKRSEDQVGEMDRKRRDSASSNASPDVSLHDLCDAVTVNDDDTVKKKEAFVKAEASLNEKIPTKDQIESTKDRFANKVLCRLSNKRSIAAGLIFSRGHFLGDIEKMVEGLLSSADESGINAEDDHGLSRFGELDDALSLDTMAMHDLNLGHHTVHRSTLAAGKDGCVAMVLQKASLLPFLDAHPGLLLSLLGTQVVV